MLLCFLTGISQSYIQKKDKLQYVRIFLTSSTSFFPLKVSLFQDYAALALSNFSVTSSSDCLKAQCINKFQQLSDLTSHITPKQVTFSVSTNYNEFLSLSSNPKYSCP